VTQVRGDGLLLRGVGPEEIEMVLPRVAPVELAAGDEVAVARKRARLERSGERTEWEIWFAIEAGGRLVGDIQGRCSDAAMPPGVWELGIELWNEGDRGRGYGREACALLTSHLFEAEGAIRSLGCELTSPVLSIAFSVLPTIPAYGLTDFGLYDVAAGEFVDVVLETAP